MDYGANKFNLNFFLNEFHNLATEIREGRPVNTPYFCSQFSHSSLEETISIAKTFIYPTEDPSVQETQIQLEADIKILTDYLVKADSRWQSTGSLNKIFGNLFNPQSAEVQKNSKDVSRTTLQKALDFLNDFAPNRTRAFQKELHGKPAKILFQQVIDEIESHLGDISKAIAARQEMLSLYSQPGTVNKLLRLKKNISFLIRLFNENQFNEPAKAYKAVYQELSKDSDDAHIEAKTIKLLKTLHAEIASCKQKQRKQIDLCQSTAISDFMASCFDGVEVSRKSILEQFSKCLQLQIPTDWFEVLKQNPTMRMEIQTFSQQFCEIKEHAAKIRLFHNFITEWLEKYPPDARVGSEEMLTYIQAIFVLAASPEFLLQVLLLEQDSISFQPHAPALMNSDYAAEEYPAASGINCYDYLNLMNALTSLCQKSTQQEMEVEMLQKKGSALYKKFNATCDLRVLSPQNMPREKRELEDILLHSAQLIEIIYSDKIKGFDLRESWQFDLVGRNDFIHDACQWATRFCSETNSIVKLNQHREAVSKMAEEYVTFSYDPSDFLAALLKAADNPGVIPAIAYIESDSPAWRISEGFIGDAPVNAAKRIEDLKALQALVNKL